MRLTYEKYLDLLSAIDEYTNMKLTKTDIQNQIYQHFIDKYGSFVAVNARHEAKLFRGYKHKPKQFRNFMNKNGEIHNYRMARRSILYEYGGFSGQ